MKNEIEMNYFSADKVDLLIFPNHSCLSYFIQSFRFFSAHTEVLLQKKLNVMIKVYLKYCSLFFSCLIVKCSSLVAKTDYINVLHTIVLFLANIHG